MRTRIGNAYRGCFAGFPSRLYRSGIYVMWSRIGDARLGRAVLLFRSLRSVELSAHRSLRGSLGFVMSHVAPYLRFFARESRRQPTPQENMLWMWLRGRRFGGYKFRRQHPIGRVVADFYCAALKLVIEVDGRQHETSPGLARDEARTLMLMEQGISVIRIQNEELRRQQDVVEERIRWAIEKAEQGMILPEDLV